MRFLNNIKKVQFRDEEVIHFEASENGYYAILFRGERLDILHVFLLQPPIEDVDDYVSFMFVEVLQGFFLFRQKVIEGKTQPWDAWLEFKAFEPHSFYNDAYEYWRRVMSRIAGRNQ